MCNKCWLISSWAHCWARILRQLHHTSLPGDTHRIVFFLALLSADLHTNKKVAVRIIILGGVLWESLESKSRPRIPPHKPHCTDAAALARVAECCMLIIGSCSRAHLFRRSNTRPLTLAAIIYLFVFGMTAGQASKMHRSHIAIYWTPSITETEIN